LITDINYRSDIGPDLRREKLNSYWNEYFAFERETSDLHRITEVELIASIEGAKSLPRPFLDSQQVISKILTDLGSSHNFHRQFNEAHQHAKAGQVLGMQLYSLVTRDNSYWVYHPTQHPGHMFPHATYFIPPVDIGYERFVQQRAE
jgi:hypothetical protein